MRNIGQLNIFAVCLLFCSASTEILPAQSQISVKIPAGMTNTQVSEGWIALFDGESLFGWSTAKSRCWEMNPTERTISCEAESKPEMLRTTAQFDDYVLELEFKLAANSLGKVLLRTNPKPKNLGTDCYAIQIGNTIAGPPLGSIVDRANSSLQNASTADKWHRLKVSASGPKIRVWINGKQTVSTEDPKPLGRGYIGAQVDDGEIAFRNIRLQPLGPQKLINGKDLTGWNTEKRMDSEYTITKAGELSVVNGRGQLESSAKFADFVLSFQCKTNAAGLNSGVFFRCIPGDLMNGYECQIQNEIKNGNPGLPKDCGTGGIFRRANARRVNANDQDWFSTTLVATGPRISVWVNGLQVTDWVDRRKPAANPRRGYRSEAGTLAIQGHDPTTDLLFREFKARELTVRRP
jgi:hypothetical protein